MNELHNQSTNTSDTHQSIDHTDQQRIYHQLDNNLKASVDHNQQNIQTLQHANLDINQSNGHLVNSQQQINTQISSQIGSQINQEHLNEITILIQQQQAAGCLPKVLTIDLSSLKNYMRILIDKNLMFSSINNNEMNNSIQATSPMFNSVNINDKLSNSRLPSFHSIVNRSPTNATLEQIRTSAPTSDYQSTVASNISHSNWLNIPMQNSQLMHQSMGSMNSTGSSNNFCVYNNEIYQLNNSRLNGQTSNLSIGLDPTKQFNSKNQTAQTNGAKRLKTCNNNDINHASVNQFTTMTTSSCTNSIANINASYLYNDQCVESLNNGIGQKGNDSKSSDLSDDSQTGLVDQDTIEMIKRKMRGQLGSWGKMKPRKNPFKISDTLNLQLDNQSTYAKIANMFYHLNQQLGNSSNNQLFELGVFFGIMIYRYPDVMDNMENADSSGADGLKKLFTDTRKHFKDLLKKQGKLKEEDESKTEKTSKPNSTVASEDMENNLNQSKITIKREDTSKTADHDYLKET